MFDKNFHLRYSKQIMLPEIGLDGQKKLLKAKVLCVGIGGLGSSVLMHLASAGVGKIGIMDNDIIDLSNLHRQVIFNTEELGKSKINIAEKYIKKLNPTVSVECYNEKLFPNNAINILKNYDIVIDCTDNLASKNLINSCAIKLNIPMIYGAVYGFEGYISIFKSDGPCYNCIYEDISNNYIPNCSESGILGVVSNLVGNIQALETIKLIVNNKKFVSLCSKLMIINCKTLSFKFIKLKKNVKCNVCRFI